VGTQSTPALADVDSDGDLDLVVGAADGTLRYFKHTASGYVEQTGASNPFNAIDVGNNSAPAFADVDGDGDLDAFIGEDDALLHCYRAQRAPVVINAIPDQTFSGPGVHAYTAPADIFFDLEGDSFTCTAKQTSGAALPGWLSFDSATRTFSGNPDPDATSPLQLCFNANDGNGGIGFDDFELSLTDVADNSLVVNTLADENDGNSDPSQGAGTSLREAINYAITLGGSPAITFASSLTSGGPATLTLGGAELSINKTMSITGPGAGLLSISGNNTSRVFRIIGGSTVSMSGLTISGGNNSFGGGIRIDNSTLNLSETLFSGNHASDSGGGLMAVRSSVTISNCTFTNNSAASSGAGIHNASTTTGGNPPAGAATMTLTNCTITGNVVNSPNGQIILNDSKGNSATMTLRACTIAANSATSGVVGNLSDPTPALLSYVDTIFANSAPNIVNAGGTLTSLGHNLSSDATGNLTAAGDLPSTNPMLDSLRNNGGPTPTMQLLTFSPAIDKGVFVGTNCRHRCASDRISDGPKH
jgi:CSLREA domain-containing protein